MQKVKAFPAFYFIQQTLWLGTANYMYFTEESKFYQGFRSKKIKIDWVCIAIIELILSLFNCCGCH